MKLDLYQRSAPGCDFPEYNLKRGDVATLIDYVPHPNKDENGCVLEIFNAIGESIGVVPVPASTIAILRANDVIAIRKIDALM